MGISSTSSTGGTDRFSLFERGGTQRSGTSKGLNLHAEIQRIWRILGRIVFCELLGILKLRGSPFRGEAQIWVPKWNGGFGFWAFVARQGMPSFRMPIRSRGTLITESSATGSPSQREISTLLFPPFLHAACGQRDKIVTCVNM